MINPALQSYLDFLVADRREHYNDVMRYRRYVEGEHTAQLNSDQIALLNKDPKFVLNACEPPLTAKCDRMTVQGFQITDPANETRGDELSELVRKWWDLSRMDAQSYTLHFSASRDGDGYLITDYDAAKLRPRFTVNQQYDGSSGVDVAYDTASGGTPIYATKRWTKINPNDPSKSTARLNVYYADRVAKYFSVTTGSYVEAGWMPYLEDGDPEGKALWVDSNGAPLGLAVTHFANNAQGSNYGRSDISDIVPGLQDVLNLAGVSIVAAAQLAGFPVNYLLGVNDAGATYKTYPGALLVASGKEGGNLTAGQLPAANLVQLVDVKNSIVRDIASRTHTPLSYFNTTGQIAGAETLQQQEAPLIAKVKRAHTTYGNGYEDAVRLALKLEATFGALRMSVEEIDNLDIKCLWVDPHTRNEKEETERYKLWLEMGIEEEIVWRRLGLSEDEIQKNKDARMERQQTELAGRETQTNQVLARMADAMAGVSQNGNGNGQTEGNGGTQNPNGQPARQPSQV